MGSAEGTVGGGAGGALGGQDGRAVGGVGAGVQEAFPNELDGGVGGVDEVVGIKAVVAEFVEQDLIGGEVLGAGEMPGRGQA